jgi:predicted ribosome quality control (RQC) complex YloA/Tae2 family protein
MAKKANFRKFQTQSGKLVLAGRDEESNEELIEQVNQNELVFHTKVSGSPFVNIKSLSDKTTKEDIKETALFCALFSKDWKKNRHDIIMHIFLGKDIYKTKDMKTGTFGVKNFKEIKLKRQEIEAFEKLIKPKQT